MFDELLYSKVTSCLVSKDSPLSSEKSRECNKQGRQATQKQISTLIIQEANSATLHKESKNYKLTPQAVSLSTQEEMTNVTQGRGDKLVLIVGEHVF